MKTYFISKKAVALQLIVHLILSSYSICLYAATNESLPIKERIVGVNNTHKKALQKYSIYQPHTTFLWMPIKKWLYQWGKSHFNLEKIENDIDHIKKKYEYSMHKATSEKEKSMLMAKRDRLIELKENIATNGNRLMRMGEKPICYDPVYVQRNEKMFLNYLHAKGYLDAQVTSKTDFQKKKHALPITSNNEICIKLLP